MGIFNLFGFCIALLFAPALAFANDVRVGVSPTTGYYEVTSKTFNVPKGASVSSSTAVSPTVTPLAGGGFQQSMGGGITIEGLKKPAPFTARAAAGLSTMKNGAKKLAKSNPARFIAGAGLAAFLDSLDWLIEDGAIAQKSFSVPELIPDSYYDTLNTGSCQGSYYDCHGKTQYVTGPLPNNPGRWRTCSMLGPYGTGYLASYSGTTCYYVRDKLTPTVTEAISESDINKNIDSKYSPHASDFVLLTPYMPPDYILVDPILPVVTDLGITNTFDSSGWLTGTEQKTSTTEFTVSNNSTSQPSISSSTSVKTETFKDGQSQGSTVTEITQPAVGGGGGKAPTVEIPTDCDFHPTLCAWMNWTKEPLEEPDHDLKQIMHTVDFEEKKTISFGSKSCPAPYDIHLGLIDRTYQLSFQPACDFAGYLYFFVMAAAYIFAAYISVGVVRNG